MKKIGVIGLGHMGQPMAINLLKAGFAVHVYDVEPGLVTTLVQHGGVAEKSAVDVAEACDVVITMVQSGKQVEQICLGDEGIFQHLSSKKIYIDCSSIDIVTTRALHEAAEKRGIGMLDAPVSGGVAGAAAGTLTLMVGGDAALFAKAMPVLKALGKKIVHAGEAGSGQAAKICNNLLLGISMLGVSEAFTLAQKLGLDPKKFFEISSNASGQCWSMTSYCPVPGIIENVPSNNHYEPGFMAKMMLKDLRLAQHAAEAVNAAIPMGAITAELYDLYVTQGNGEKDFSGIINLISGTMH